MNVVDKYDVAVAAKNLIGRYGSDAARQAKIRSEEMMKYCEEEAELLWLRVRNYIENMPCGKT